MSREHPAHFGRGPGLKPRHGLLAIPGGVRGEDDVVAPAQRMHFGQGLGIGGVQCAAGDRLVVERPHQRLGVDDRSARAIDQNGARLHAFERRVIDQLAGFWHQWRMQRNEIRLCQQGLELALLGRDAVPALLDERIEEENPHAERGCPRRHVPRDVAEADQPQGAPAEAEHRLARRHLPSPGPHQPIVQRDDLAGRGQQQRHGVLGHLVDAIGRVVGDDDAGRGGGIEIDRVHTDAVAGDDLAFRHSRHRLGRDRPRIGVEQRVAVGHMRQELLERLRLERDELGDALQRLLLHVQRIPDVVRKYDLRLCGHSISSRVAGDCRVSAMFRPACAMTPFRQRVQSNADRGNRRGECC